MLTIIFGAGASYDALPDFPPRALHPFRLPLADGLFENREVLAQTLSYFPQIPPVLPSLRYAGSSVEQELERLRTEAAEYPERHRQLAAIRYYLQLAIYECGRRWIEASKGVTNYRALIDQANRRRKPGEPILLITFNYDVMLEDALRWYGIEIGDMDDYVKSPDYKLIKIHGSVNWGRQLLNELNSVTPGTNAWQIVNRILDNLERVKTSDAFFVTNSQPVVSVSSEDIRALFPAIAIPVQEKAEFECPAHHLNVMKEHLRKTTKLLTIGWRGRERHFLEVLKKEVTSSIWLHAIGKNQEDAAATVKELRDAGIQGPYTASEKAGFTEFIVSRELDSFLTAGQ